MLSFRSVCTRQWRCLPALLTIAWKSFRLPCLRLDRSAARLYLMGTPCARSTTLFEHDLRVRSFAPHIRARWGPMPCRALAGHRPLVWVRPRLGGASGLDFHQRHPIRLCRRRRRHHSCSPPAAAVCPDAPSYTHPHPLHSSCEPRPLPPSSLFASLLSTRHGFPACLRRRIDGRLCGGHVQQVCGLRVCLGSEHICILLCSGDGKRRRLSAKGWASGEGAQRTRLVD